VRFYFDTGSAVFRVDPERSLLEGFIAPEAFNLPHLLVNTHTLFALLLLLRARGLYHLHAAAVVSPRNELYLICGEQRSGKTTLTTALGLAGWRPISDDSLLVRSHPPAAQIVALRKSFHISNDILARWRTLDPAARHHCYFERTSVAGLEFFETSKLAEASFSRVDYIILPQITGRTSSSLAPVPLSEVILKLAEQSMFFQLWRTHTQQQLHALTQLARAASGYRLLAGTDLLSDPNRSAELLEKAVRSGRVGVGD